MRKYWIIIFCLISQFTWAQVYTLSGTVTDASNKQPIPGVVVGVLNKGTVTDINGNYKLEIEMRPSVAVFEALVTKHKPWVSTLTAQKLSLM